MLLVQGVQLVPQVQLVSQVQLVYQVQLVHQIQLVPQVQLVCLDHMECPSLVPAIMLRRESAKIVSLSTSWCVCCSVPVSAYIAFIQCMCVHFRICNIFQYTLTVR